ncbi:MAG: hypothetical protein IE926_12925 [Micrococcales bacterium]|nr:hypothetical protein [Micrococcales bacterium]
MRSVLGAVVGGLLGFTVGAVVYLGLTPVLERSTGILRETQGLLWNLVPLLALVGVVVGGWLARRHRP